MYWSATSLFICWQFFFSSSLLGWRLQKSKGSSSKCMYSDCICHTWNLLSLSMRIIYVYGEYTAQCMMPCNLYEFGVQFFVGYTAFHILLRILLSRIKCAIVFFFSVYFWNHHPLFQDCVFLLLIFILAVFYWMHFAQRNGKVEFIWKTFSLGIG